MAMGFIYEAIEVGQIPEQGINIGVISYVVAEVDHGRDKNWRQPDGIDAKLCQIGQPMYDPPKVSYAVVIAVLKRAGIDLINDPGLPPLRAFSWHRQTLLYTLSNAPLNPAFLPLMS
jgi:hypothetical protein